MKPAVGIQSNDIPGINHDAEPPLAHMRTLWRWLQVPLFSAHHLKKQQATKQSCANRIERRWRIRKQKASRPHIHQKKTSGYRSLTHLRLPRRHENGVVVHRRARPWRSHKDPFRVPAPRVWSVSENGTFPADGTPFRACHSVPIACVHLPIGCSCRQKTRPSVILAQGVSNSAVLAVAPSHIPRAV